MIAADEISRIPGTHINATSYRRIEFSYRAANALLEARTVDDIFLSIASWNGVLHTREALHLLRS